MAEAYSGVKFKTVFEGKKFAYAKERAQIVEELKRLGADKVLDRNNGNISVRVGKGLIITPTGKDMDMIVSEDLVLVTSVDEKKKIVTAIGPAEPSSESIMHWLIYKKFPKANAIVHFHDKGLLENHKKFVETKTEFPYGTVELARAALKALVNSSFILLKNHGALTIGKDMDSCDRQVEKALKSVR